MKWTADELASIRKKINYKASTDQKFRSLCLHNPYEAVRQISGKSVPEGVKIRLIENEGAHLTHVLPDLVSDELSEVELEQVTAAGSKSQRLCGSCREPIDDDTQWCPHCGMNTVPIDEIR